MIQAGEQYGRWAVLGRAANTLYGHPRWAARCTVCGTVNPNVEQRQLIKSAHKMVCVCHTNKRRTTHGASVSPEAVLLYSAKELASSQDLPYSITLADIFIPPTCPLLGIPLVRGKGKPGANSPTLDRIIPERGYVRGNVMVISHKANTIKNNATPDELRRIADALEPFYKGALTTT